MNLIFKEMCMRWETKIQLIFLFNFLQCLLLWEWERERERQRQRMSRGGWRERETQNPKQAPGPELSTQSPTRGSNSWAVRSWPELKSDTQPTEPPRRPRKLFFKCMLEDRGKSLTSMSISSINCGLVFIFERERQSMSSGRAERGRHRIESRLQALSHQHRAQCGARTHELRDGDLNLSQMLNRLSHPGALNKKNF